MGRGPEHSFYSGSGYCGRLCHHPHIHFLVPGGGIAPDGEHWIACRPGFFLPVRVLAWLFRRLFLEHLAADELKGAAVAFFGTQAALADPKAFKNHLAPLPRRGRRRVVDTTRSDRSAARRPSWLTFPAIPTGSPSPTGA